MFPGGHGAKTALLRSRFCIGATASPQTLLPVTVFPIAVGVINTRSCGDKHTGYSLPLTNLAAVVHPPTPLARG